MKKRKRFKTILINIGIILIIPIILMALVWLMIRIGFGSFIAKIMHLLYCLLYDLEYLLYPIIVLGLFAVAWIFDGIIKIVNKIKEHFKTEKN